MINKYKLLMNHHHLTHSLSSQLCCVIKHHPLIVQLFRIRLICLEDNNNHSKMGMALGIMILVITLIVIMVTVKMMGNFIKDSQ